MDHCRRKGVRRHRFCGRAPRCARSPDLCVLSDSRMPIQVETPFSKTSAETRPRDTMARSTPPAWMMCWPRTILGTWKCLINNLSSINIYFLRVIILNNTALIATVCCYTFYCRNEGVVYSTSLHFISLLL